MKIDSSMCPAPETLAAFVDGRLDEHDREPIAAHLAGCERCYFVFTEAVQRTASQPAAGTDRWWSRRRVVWSGAATLAAAAALVLAVRSAVAPGSTGELDALVAAVGTERTIEPRLTGGFAYGPVRGATRAGEPVVDSLPPDARIAVAQIEKQALADRTPATLRALGIAYLVMGDASRAVPVLEEAADRATADARVLSDLSAAYSVRAARTESPKDWARALAVAERAVSADQTLPEAHFNRAYALEMLSLRDQAREAWQHYLALDGASGWANEARRRLAALNEQSQLPTEDDRRRLASAAERNDIPAIQTAVSQSPEWVRLWMYEHLLEVWPRAVIGADDRAARDAIARLRNVAAAFAAVTQDRLVADAVDAIGRYGDSTALATSHATFQRASASYQADRIAAAMPDFAAAQATLDRAASPLAPVAALHLAIGRYYAGDFSAALTQLAEVVRVAEPRSYLRVAGQGRRVWGLILGVKGDFAGALQQYRMATAHFQRARDIDSEVSIRALTAEVLVFLGETDQAWFEIAQSLRHLPAVRDNRTRHNVFQHAAISAMREDLPESATHFQKAVLANAIAWQRPLAIFDAHLYQSEIYKQTGDWTLARAELTEARRAFAAVTDEQLRARYDGRLELTEGEIESNTGGARAIDNLTSALETYERTERQWPIARVLLARGRAYDKSGPRSLAQRDFSAGIDLFEARRTAIADEALRSASFEQPWDLYSEMIRLQVSQRQTDAALSFAERGRARTLVDALATSVDPTTSDPQQARLWLPAGTAVLYFVSLPEQTLLWVLSARDHQYVELDVTQNEIVHLLNQFKSEVAASPTTARDTRSLQALYDVLLRPAFAHVRQADHLVVVPDGALHRVPFAALIRREDRRYLLEEFAVQVVPSLTVLARATARATRISAADTALVIGNPTLAAEDRQFVADLPEAAAEAKEVASFYPAATLLLAQQATKARFLDDVAGAAVVHFAGHAIANERDPRLSRFLLAGDDPAERSLFASEIAARALPRTQVVVLAACRTNDGRIRRGEGVFSLARPFLAAGVPVVLASLWDVDDRASRQLLVAFHRALREAPSAAEALRRAQMRLMADTNPYMQGPSAWGGFVVIGGLNGESSAGASVSKH
jgi:CHAT domain-containing protein/Flp pilus assembly protein TadD